jgi:hypothetical protein
MLTIPLILGTACAGTITLAGLLVWPAVVLAFLARYAALPAAVRVAHGKATPGAFLARRFVWSAIETLASVACLAGCVLAAPSAARPAAVFAALATGLLGAAHTALALIGKDRMLGGEIVGMTGLASSATLVMAATGRPVDGPAAGVALLALLYFLSALASVRAYRAPAEGRRRAAALGAFAQFDLALAAAGLVGAGWLPTASLLSILPPAIRTAWSFAAPPASLRAAGLREVGVAAAFTAIASLALLP